MESKIALFVFFILLISSQTYGINVQTLKHCCGIGTVHAESGLPCGSYSTPFPNVDRKDEGFCMKSVDVCCKNKFRESQCSLGQEDALSRRECKNPEGISSDGLRKDCCEACQLGIASGISGQSCSTLPGLGSPYDNAFRACCEDKDLIKTKSLKTVATKQQTTLNFQHTTPTNPVTTSTTSRVILDDNYPPLENICEITDVCAQVCIPTTDSYRCDCKEGYTLMADGVSCKVKKLPSIIPPASNTPIDRCDENNPCEHQCKDTGVSIQCSCYEGFELDEDKVSCNDIDECALGLHECLTSQTCINEPGSYNCGNDIEDYDMCPNGYVFNAEKKVCDDFDECQFGITCESHQTCVNTMGGYECKDNPIKCPPGFFFKDSIQDCEDIDECILGQHDCNRASQMCLNTKGNFTCIDKTTQGGCPPGFKKNSITLICEDINECEENEELCGPNEVCVNESGGHTCVPNAIASTPSKTKPFDYVPSRYTPPNIIPTTPPTTTSTTSTTTESTTRTTSQHTELITKNPDVKPYVPPIRETEHRSFASTPSRETEFPSTTPIYTNVRPPHSRYPGYQPPASSTNVERKPSYNSGNITSFHTRDPVYPPSPPTHVEAQSPQSKYPGYPPRGISLNVEKQHTEVSRTTTPFPVPSSSTLSSKDLENVSPYKPPYFPHYNQKSTPISCREGFRYSEDHRTCIDINECHEEEDICDSTQDCVNTHGSYFCNCKKGFSKDITGACVDINECQLGLHDCSEGQRCDNTIGSYYCPRTAGCGTGYTLNHANNVCEDDDECTLATDKCKQLGTQFQCKNTLGSYRCERIPRIFYISSTPFTYPSSFRPSPNVIISTKKTCLPGYIMNSRGDCEDIDECKNNPCARSERCFNLNGRYQCISRLQCKLGFELNEGGTECVDIDECARGTHQCSSTQICKNGFGYHVCTCPPGHKLNVNNHCEDINECEYYRGRACSNNAECINTVGSFECRCHEGLKQRGRDVCDDIDECSEISGLCQQKCVNLWGSYRCSCDRGYSLNADNRSCSDIDECEKFKDQHLCIATCQNTPGSYVCSCPRGYRLGSDGRTCQDIDECLDNVCGRPDATCLNTRGSYKCFTIDCPHNYIRDPDHKSRCKRAKHACDQRDQRCLEMPQQYSYHFMTFISRLPILQGHIDFFQMRGPMWDESSADFTMKIVNVNCPEGVERVHDGFFRMNTLRNKAILALVRSIEGPQEIELQLELKLYYNHIFNSKMVAKIFLIVSEYPF